MALQFSAPLYIAWETTLRCNAKCVHCYSNSGSGIRHPNELNTNEAIKMIDQLADAGLMILAFSGGEPLLRKDIFELMAYASSRHLVVNIATNGALLTEKTASKMKEAGVSSVTVSLDGANQKTHDSIRQFPGLFKKTVRAIETLVRNNLRVVVSFTPMKNNFDEGPDVVRLAYELGASAVNMSEYVPAGRGTTQLALEPQTLRFVVNQWIEMRRQYVDKMQIIWHDCRVALLVPPEEQDRYSGCGAGKLTARIMVDGTLTPCVFLSTPAGNLRTDTFKVIWEHSPLLLRIRNRDNLLTGNCGSCVYKHQCGGCRAAAMSHGGDLFSGDPSCWVIESNPSRRVNLPLLSASMAN